MDYETEQDNLYTVGSILRSKPVEEPTVVSDSGIAVANDTDPNHPNQNPEEDTHGQSFITKALSGTSSVGSDVGKAIVKGGAKGAEETLYGAAELIGAPVDFVNFIASKVPGVGQYISSDMPIGGSDSIKYVLDAYSNFVNDNIPGVQTANTWVGNLEYDNDLLGGITEGLAQFSVAAVPAATMVRALTSANAFVRGLYWGAIADYAAFNPNDPTLTVMLTEMWDGATPEERTKLGNTVVSILEKNEASPEIINRAKSMIEGGIFGGATEGLIKVFVEGAKYVPWKQVIGGALAGGAMNIQNPSEAEGGVLTSVVKGALKSGDNVVDNVVDSTMVILPKQVNEGSDMVLEYPSLFHGTTVKDLDFLDINKSRRTVFGAIPAINATDNKKLASAFTKGELGKDPEGEIYNLKGPFKILNLKNNEGRSLWEQTYNRDPQKALKDGYDGIQFQQLENDRIKAFYKDINVDDVEDAVEIQLFKPRIEIEKTTDTSLKSGDNVVDNVVSPLTDGRISPRLPTAVNATEDGVTNSLQIDLVSNKANKNQFDTNVKLISDYPNLKSEEVLGKTSDEIADTYVNHLKNNILWLYDRVPEATRLRSKQWYNGANKVTNTWAKEYNISNNSVAGVLAALSPQKDWYMNASLGNRVIDIMTNKQEFVFDKKMMQTAKQIYGSPKFANTIKFLSGKKLSELDNAADKSMWLRIYDEAHNDRSYRILSPEGDFGDFVKGADGQNAKVAWNSNVMIKNAINAFESGGDPAIITKFLGDRHKVRSFYNNIIAPNSDAGDVTIDTHAVAAATLRPVSGNSSIVFHNFGTSPLLAKRPKDWNGATANSSVNGVKGTYAFYAEAYRLAAAEKGILPREMQSITWEAVRGLFPANFKQNAKNVEKIDALWYNYRDGQLSLEEVLNGIEQITGGIKPPSWE